MPESIATPWRPDRGEHPDRPKCSRTGGRRAVIFARTRPARQAPTTSLPGTSDVRPLLEHDGGRFGIAGDVELRGRPGHVAGGTHRAAHDDQPPVLAGQIRVEAHREGDIGERPERHQGELAGRLGRQPHQGERGVLGLDQPGGRREVAVAQPVGAMRSGFDAGSEERSPTKKKNRRRSLSDPQLRDRRRGWRATVRSSPCHYRPRP
jgi:hypothetical protein